MKFNCGLNGTDWKAKREGWHRWFAWRPIQLTSYDCRWLEVIERKGAWFAHGGYAGGGWWDWDYRAIKDRSIK